MIENKDYFLGKWRERWGSDDLLVRYKIKQFIEIITDAEMINVFDEDLYLAFVEKITVHDGGRLIVSLLDGTEIECQS